MRVNDQIIAQCRSTLEPAWKRGIRSLVSPMIAWRAGIIEVGEGFQWGLPFHARAARIGRYVYLGAGCVLPGPLVIGDLTMISTRVVLVGHDHDFDNPRMPMRLNFPASTHPVTIIESDCWIGHGAILYEGLTLSRGTIVAAGAVVTRSTLPYSIVGGVPARPLRQRFTPEQQAEHDLLLYGCVPPATVHLTPQ